MDKHSQSPLTYIILSKILLLLALNSRQTNIGAIFASALGIYSSTKVMQIASSNFVQDEINTILKNAEIARYEILAQNELSSLIPSESETPYLKSAEVDKTTLPEPGGKSDNEEPDEAYEAVNNLELYDWEQISQENSLLVGGEPGSAKTSVVAGYLVPRISTAYDCEIIVLDSHAKKNRWKEMGYHRVVHDYEEIYNCLLWLDSERERRRNDPNPNHLIVCIFDEINDMWSYLERDDKATKGKRLVNARLILQTLLNCRKFDIQIIGMMQSHLCEDIGLSGAVRRQALVILLNGSAREEGIRNKNKLSPEQSAFLFNKERPYSCLITGYHKPIVAEHPTHGHYTSFSKKGKVPENISKPIVRSINTIPFGLETKDSSIPEEDSACSLDSLNPEAVKLEAILNSGNSGLSPESFIPDSWNPVDPLSEEITPDARGLIRELILSKAGKQKAIKLVFDAKPGSSRKYKAASLWYETIKSEVGL